MLATIGKNVRIMRAVRGYTQATLADAASVTRESVWALETQRNAHEPKLQTLVRVAAALDVSMAQLCKPIEVTLDDSSAKLS